LNGKRWNGIGKEFYECDELKFEGEYLNGKRNGNGKEYNLGGTIIFEGKYLNGKRWNGKFKEYKYNSGNQNDLIFKGEYLNGEKKSSK